MKDFFSSGADFGGFSDGPGGRNPRSSRNFSKVDGTSRMGGLHSSLSEMLIVQHDHCQILWSHEQLKFYRLICNKLPQIAYTVQSGVEVCS